MALSQFAFAILRPANAVAKISFNTVYETASRHQTAAHSCQMHVKTEQEYDREVFLFRSQQRRKQQLQQTCGDVPEDVMSDTPTEPDTDNEQELRHLGVVWAGYYQFDLDCPPADPQIGWTVGKGREGMSIDFLVTTRNISHEVKGYHARFNLHPNTGYLYISKTSGAVTTKVAVNGNDVSCRQAYALNQTPMNIRMGQLEYTFEYTEIACSDSFYKRREEYMKSHLNGSVPNPSLTPTPAGQARTIGSWTFNASLGRGAFGKVFTATNSRNHVVAIKIVERNSKTANEVEHEIQVLQDLKRLAETENDEGRLVRLRETIYQDGKQEYKSASFEDVALVFEPAAESDFTQLIDTAANQRLQLGR